MKSNILCDEHSSNFVHSVIEAVGAQSNIKTDRARYFICAKITRQNINEKCFLIYFCLMSHENKR